MRVITGTARGRVLKELEGLETRPTTGKVKESLFSIIQFDIVFLDPPYASGLLQQALTDIAAFDICRAHGIIIAESAVDTVLPEMPAPYALYREYRYGKIKLTVYHRGGNEDTE